MSLFRKFSKATPFTKVVLSFATAALVVVVLAPFTGGRSLSGLCVLGVLAFIAGLGYVLFSGSPKRGGH